MSSRNPPRFAGMVRAWMAAGFVIAAAVAAWALWPATVLEIRSGQEARLVRSFPVDVGGRITYTYLHSVQKSRIDEVLEVVQGDRLVVRETAYDMFGAGLPSDLPDGDYYLDPADGRFHIVNMSRDLPVMRVRVAFTAQQTLQVGQERMRLDSLAPPTTLLVVQAVTVPRMVSLLRR